MGSVEVKDSRGGEGGNGGGDIGEVPLGEVVRVRRGEGWEKEEVTEGGRAEVGGGKGRRSWGRAG